MNGHGYLSAGLPVTMTAMRAQPRCTTGLSTWQRVEVAVVHLGETVVSAPTSTVVVRPPGVVPRPRSGCPTRSKLVDHRLSATRGGKRRFGTRRACLQDRSHSHQRRPTLRARCRCPQRKFSKPSSLLFGQCRCGALALERDDLGRSIFVLDVPQQDERLLLPSRVAALGTTREWLKKSRWNGCS